MAEELSIKFSTAELAKIKGYNESTLYFYDNDKELCSYANATFYHNNDKGRYSAPTQKKLTKWLENNYKIKVDAKLINDKWETIVLYTDIDQEETFSGLSNKKDAIEHGLRESLLFITK